MTTTLPTQRGSDPAAFTTPIPRVDAPWHLSTRTVARLANHPQTRQLSARCGTSSPSWSDPVTTPAPSMRCGVF
jgi:hypothetical protein